MPELYQGFNTSVEINSTQDSHIKTMEWENLGIAKVLTRSLDRAVSVKKLKEKKEAFHNGTATLGELLQEIEEA